jgi:hypothetical protein
MARFMRAIQPEALELMRTCVGMDRPNKSGDDERVEAQLSAPAGKQRPGRTKSIAHVRS